MLVFDSMAVGPLSTNCYIIGDSETHEAMVVDPGGHVGAIMSALDRHNLACKWIVNTHAHFDHIGGNRGLKEKTGAELIIHELEAGWLSQLSVQGRMFGISVENSPPADRTLSGDETLEVGKIQLKVLHTPGHSPGSISLAIEGEKKIVVGDLVFADSIGRTDLPEGSFESLQESVRRHIFTQTDDTALYPGHGPATTVGHERRYNPFLNGSFVMTT
jgi:hydroxyacylglutathione hydrolase